jgi:hypothetical protein
VGAWRLASKNSLFGGYSALLATPGNTLTAFSDLGAWLRFSQPGAKTPARPRFGKVPVPFDRYYPDVEAATQDEARGLFWLSYEKANRIRRFEFGRRSVVTIAPRSMRDWPENGGAESMTRLADGRFIVLEEDPPLISAGGRPGLLFATDPEIAREPVEFVFRPPIGYAPSDMAALPDGRVLILLRTLDLTRIPVFKSMLIVADPAAIVKGKEWPWRKLADVDDPTLRENYEGLAIVPDDAGVTLWLISDDNLSRLQHTLLLELHWALPPRSAALSVRRPRRTS